MLALRSHHKVALLAHRKVTRQSRCTVGDGLRPVAYPRGGGGS